MKQIIKNFQIDQPVTQLAPHGNGHIHETYRVHTQNSAHPTYLLQKINSTVFPNISGVMQNIQYVTQHLQNQNQKNPFLLTHILSIIPTVSGGLFYTDEQGYHWRLYPFIRNSHALDRIETPQQAYAIGHAFGEFEYRLSDLPAHQLVETIPYFHSVDQRFRSLEHAFLEHPEHHTPQILEIMAYVRDLTPAMKRVEILGASHQLPKRVTHNDTKFNNVLLDQQSGKALCVIDLDTVMPGYLQYDFSDGIRTVVNTAPEDEPDCSKIRLNLDFFSAYTEGFLMGVKNMTPIELQELISSSALLPYLLTLRFLTDHLQGDGYFKVAFRGHNLQRAQAQMTLVKQFQSQQKILQETTYRIIDRLGINTS